MNNNSDISDINSEYYINHGKLLCSSFKRLLKRGLLENSHHSSSEIVQLFQAPFVLLSHGTEQDPVFNFGNRMALELFELEGYQLLQMPSRKSAESVERSERGKFLKTVSDDGFIENYSGIRISATGQRFLIENAIVWNVVNENNVMHGQAAMFKHWKYI